MRQQQTVPDWDSVKSDYDGNALSVSQLCERHGVTMGQLYRRIRLDGWTKRTETAAAGGLEHDIPRAMLSRLRNIISRRIRHIETASAGSATGETALESERQARAIAALVRALEQVVALEQRLIPHDKEPDGQDDGDNRAWRAQLAETLGQIFGSDADRGIDATTGQPGGDDQRDELGGDRPAGPAPAD